MAAKTAAFNLQFSRIDFFRLRGFDFYNALFYSLQRQLGEGRDFDRRWPKLGPLQQGVYAFWLFWGDVENGGLVQYFYNKGDGHIPGLVALLKVTGNKSLEHLVSKATKIYRKRQAEFDTHKLSGDDGLYARMTALNDLDRSVSGHLEAAGARIEKWLRANSQRVFVGDDGRPIDPKFTGEITTCYANGKHFEEAAVRRGTMSGAYRRFRDDGTLEHAEFYRGGKVSDDYWPNGQLKKKKTSQGDRTIHEWFYPTGQLHKRYVRAKSGDVVEPVRMWHENGQLAEELHVKGEKRFGPWLKFFDDGRPKLEARHENDEQLVIDNAWDDSRKQIVKRGTGTYVTDSVDINWEYDLTIQKDYTNSLPLRRGKLHGKRITWHRGVLNGEQHYKNGVRDGDTIIYYDNGRMRWRHRFRDGKRVSDELFPKFDHPRPAVLIEVESNDRLYTAWKLPLPDSFPEPKNLRKLQAGLSIPKFLQEVFDRNLAGTVKDSYEDINTFNDYAAYFLKISDQGEVASVHFSGAGVHSVALAQQYPAVLKQLRFAPARIGGQKIPSRAVARVCHTFAESAGK